MSNFNFINSIYLNVFINAINKKNDKTKITKVVCLSFCNLKKKKLKPKILFFFILFNLRSLFIINKKKKKTKKKKSTD